MHHLDPKPEWEVEWGPIEEEEALERLSQLPIWHTLDAARLENLMKTIRRNPAVLDSFEAESRQTRMMAEMMKEDGSMPTAQEMREAGIEFDMHRFKENEKKAAEAEAAAASAASVA